MPQTITPQREALRKELQTNWKEFATDEEAAFAVLRRKYPEVDRTQFHDDWNEQREAKLTPHERLGRDNVQPKEEGSGIRDQGSGEEKNANTAGGEAATPTANSAKPGEGSPKAKPPAAS